jgi:hypothetical protein
MNIKIIWVLIIVAVGFPSVNWAKETKTELVLLKELLDPGTLLLKGRTCDEVFLIKKGQDYPDLRDMRNYFCEGEYSLTLDGPPGTTVTLYGQFFFGEERGYLTLTKTDHRRVWLWDLEDFPNEKWGVAEANKDTGAYEVFYHAGTHFKMSLGSVKWNAIP